MDTKSCSKCKKEKLLSEFSKRKLSKDGYSPSCKVCYREYQIEYLKKNNERIKERDKKYSKKNKEKIKKFQKDYREENKDFKYRKKYYQENKEELNKKRRERYKEDPNFKLKLLLRSRIRSSIKNKSNSSMELLGCDIDFYRQYLEKQFAEGMSWNNHGAWHIDHIRPIVSFNLYEKEQLFECFNYKNTQPLWKVDNLLKGFKT